MAFVDLDVSNLELEPSSSRTTFGGGDTFVSSTLLLLLSALLPKARMPTKLWEQMGEIEILKDRCRTRPIMNVSMLGKFGVGRLSPAKETIRRR